MKYVKLFNEITKKDVAIAGGKGASLGEMTKAKIPVPEGFVILSNTFDKFIQESSIKSEIDSILKKVNVENTNSVNDASEKIKYLILNAKIPKEISKEILENFKLIDTKFVAVRSSATSEDSEDAAWAGQLDTFLNTTEKNLLTNIKKCWASLFTPRAIFYRFEKKLDETKISVAVVVQKMVQSEISGVAFSAHPVTQNNNQILIEAGLGLGEAVVSGAITPDNYVIEKNSLNIEEINIGEQTKKLVKEKGKNVWIKINKEGKNRFLDDSKLKELTTLIIQIEKHYGFPCDIEWAYEKEKFYITQSRPITTIVKKDKSENLEIISNLKKHIFERYERGPVQPVISYEYAFRSYVNNKFMKSNPNLVILQHENYEAWEEKSSRPIISDEKMIKEIIDFSLKKIEKYKPQLDNFLKDKGLNREKAREGLEFLDKLCLDIYQGYIFFCVEYFETNDEKLIKILPEVRMKLSEFIEGVWGAYDKVLFFCEKEFGLKKSAGDMCSSEEINNLLKGDEYILKIKNLDKRAIVFLISENSFKIYLDKEAEIIEDYLNSQNPLLKDIEFAKKEGILKGNVAFEGNVEGKVIRITEKDYKKYDEIFKGKKDYILVTPMTRPEIVPYIKKAKGIITDEGGITCHAAIISRELKVPCIIGTKIATKILKTGDLVKIKSDSGSVKVLR